MGRFSRWIKHRIQHRLKTNKGNLESYWKDNRLWMQFRCECGEVQDRFEWMDESEYHTGI